MFETMDYTTERLHLLSLRRDWAACVLIAALFLLGSAGLLAANLGLGLAARWLVLSGGLAVYLFANLWQHLDENRRHPEGSPINGLTDGSAELLPSFGLANRITIARAVMTSALAGFLLVPWPFGWLGWAPGVLYLLSALMDYLDGYVARITRQVTRLGERLDMQWDGTGVAIGSALVVMYGQAPVPYLLVGLARYLFMLGAWLRQNNGQPIYELPPGRFRRALAGSQMGFIAAILLPVFTPTVTQVAALLFMLPFMIGFLHDWLSVSGHFRLTSMQQRSNLRVRLEAAFPLTLRAGLMVLLVSVLMDQFGTSAPLVGIVLVGLVSIPSLALGLAGRAAAGALMLMSGFALRINPLDVRYWVLLVFSTVLFMTGTGRLSLWKPEEWLIYHRAGE